MLYKKFKNIDFNIYHCKVYVLGILIILYDNIRIPLINSF